MTINLSWKKAIHDWLNQTEDVYDNNGEAITNWRVFANKVGIPQKTFFKYINPNLEERQTLGNGARGKEMLLTHKDIKIGGAILARADQWQQWYGK